MAARYEMEQRPEQPAPGKEHRGEGNYRLRQRDSQFGRQHAAGNRNAQHRNDHDERNRRDVLKNRHRQSQPPVLAVLLTLFAEQAGDDGRGRLGEHGTEHEGHGSRKPGQPDHQTDQQCGRHDLPGSQAEHLMPQGIQSGQREIQPDGEQQEHHAELRYRLELRHRDRRPDRVRPENDAHQQIPQAGRNAQMLEGHHHADGYGEQQQDLCEVLHGIRLLSSFEFKFELRLRLCLSPRRATAVKLGASSTWN